MVAEKNESTRNLLDEIEGDWDTPRPRAVASPEVQAALDAAADRLVDSLDPPPVSVPTMDELDSGWDEGDDDEEDQDDVDEANEPELPDERLDPVAYAAAKKAREERDEARRVRRRAKAEAKKARRKARLDAQKSKQKGKQKKARPQKPARPVKEARRAAAKPARAREAGDDDDDTTTTEDTDVEPTVQDRVASRARPKLPPSKLMAKPMLSKTNQWMLAVAVIVFVAAAAFAAVVAR